MRAKGIAELVNEHRKKLKSARASLSENEETRIEVPSSMFQLTEMASLYNYLKAMGAGGKLNTSKRNFYTLKADTVHVDALIQRAIDAYDAGNIKWVVVKVGWRGTTPDP